MCYPNCLACDKPLTGSEMGRKYVTHDEWIGLCTGCHIISGIKEWTSSKKEQMATDHQSDEWERILQESFEAERLSEEEREYYSIEQETEYQIDTDIS